MSQLSQNNIDDDLIEERNRQLDDIVKEMATLHTIFEQMEDMVRAQGPDVIQISSNVERTEKEVEKGTEEIQRAYDRKWRCNIL